MFSLIGAATAWSALHFRILTFALAAQMHPGIEAKAAPFLDAVAEQVGADPSPLGGVENELAVILTFAHDETDFGRTLSGFRYDPLAFGVLQVRGPAYLEHDDAASVREWLVRLHASAKACGDARALAGISSGRCDRAVKFAAVRQREADDARAAVEGQDVLRLDVAVSDTAR